MECKVTPVDLGSLNASIRADLQAAFERVLASGRYVLGPEVESFEQAYAHYCETDFCIGVASGLDALKLALTALDIGAGDEVIVPSHAYQATWLAVVSIGARPVPVEPARGSFLIDPAGIASAVTDRTRAILPIHLYGEPCDMSSICVIARDAGVAVVEDAAQSHGAKWKGRSLGAHGDVVCWSFYPTKNLGALGDGGALTTNNLEIAKKIRSLRNYGLGSHKTLELKGLNSRLDELQAAFLTVKLKHLDAWNTERQRKAALYGKLLAGLDIELPSPDIDATSVWHQYVVQLEERDRVQETLKRQNIYTDIHYPVPVAAHPVFQKLGFATDLFPKANGLSRNILSLPISPELSDVDVKKISEAMRSAV